MLQRDAQVLSARAADQPVPIASLVKLLTALVWLQQPARLEQIVTISPHAAAATGARAGLRAGERYRGADLLSVMLVRSANDACLALAEQAAGSVEDFVVAMREAAATLKLDDSRFVNPCGWDAPGQQSSARDVLKLARAAMAQPEIRARTALRRVVLHPVDGGAAREFASTNLLLARFPGVDGVKTGFTAQAGKCLVVHAERDGHTVWLVLLGARERWWTAHRWLEAAFRDAG